MKTESDSSLWWRRHGVALGLVAGAWGLVCLVQIVAGLSDGRVLSEGGLGRLLARTLLANLPFATFCFAQHLVFARRPAATLSAKRIGGYLLGASVLCFVPLIAFEAAINPIMLGNAPWSSLTQHVAAYPALYWTFDYLVFAGCFAAVLAAHVWHAHQQVERERQAAENENLALKLSLEQQRIRILQAQLEPHFMFNALNTISALVRAGDGKPALAAIGQLSGLLRHAVTASQGTWLTLGEEFTFIGDYLALQHARFGERLSVQLPPLAADLIDVAVPGFILQPIVENAIRHDLERHSETSHLVVSIEDLGARLRIRVANPLHPKAAPNPGNGIGLANLRARLALAYGDTAQLTTAHRGDEFHAVVELPKEAP